MNDSANRWSELLESFRREIEADAVSLFVAQPEARRGVRLAWVGEEAPREWVPFGVTPLGECFVTGEPTRREVRGTRSGKFHSHLFLPVPGPEGPSAVLAFAAVAPGFFENPTRIATARALCARLPTPLAPDLPTG